MFASVVLKDAYFILMGWLSERMPTLRGTPLVTIVADDRHHEATALALLARP